MLPVPQIPKLDFVTIQHLFQPAFTIAILGAIESLLSAVVSDGIVRNIFKETIFQRMTLSFQDFSEENATF